MLIIKLYKRIIPGTHTLNQVTNNIFVLAQGFFNFTDALVNFVYLLNMVYGIDL